MLRDILYYLMVATDWGIRAFQWMFGLMWLCEALVVIVMCIGLLQLIFTSTTRLFRRSLRSMSVTGAVLAFSMILCGYVFGMSEACPVKQNCHYTQWH